MGLNASKRVERALTSSPEFDATCEAVYNWCRAEAQHAFPGVRRYQLLDAAAHLHAELGALPLVRRWVPAPPGRAQVDAAFRRTIQGGTEDLNPTDFRAFAGDLFRDAVMAGAGGAVVRLVPIGAAGIAGVGVATRAGAEVVARVMGVYAAGVAAAVYLSLS